MEAVVKDTPKVEAKQEKSRYPRAVKVWLIIGLIMVFGQVVIGGITRLTGSGLSMVEWRPLMGALPPTSASAA